MGLSHDSKTGLLGVQVQGLTGILAVPFAPLMLLSFGASLQLKPITANQVRTSTLADDWEECHSLPCLRQHQEACWCVSKAVIAQTSRMGDGATSAMAMGSVKRFQEHRTLSDPASAVFADKGSISRLLPPLHWTCHEGSNAWHCSPGDDCMPCMLSCLSVSRYPKMSCLKAHVYDANCE